MTNRVFYYLTPVILLALILSVFPGAAFAAVSSWSDKGVTISPRWNTDFSSSTFQQSVKNAAAASVNNVTLIIPLYQSSVSTTDVAPGGGTPTDQSLVDGINFVHSQGMQVTLKIHDYPNDGQWSANINPSDRATWFSNYAKWLDHYGSIAQQNNVQEIVIGNELASMTESTVNSTNTQNWVNLISGLRKIYSGKLTYGANWGGDPGFSDEKDHINFWGSLDQIGISAYFNLSDNLASSWNTYNMNEITPLSQRFGNKPVLFTEVGYKSVSGSHDNPWMWWQQGSPDMQEQSNDYQALLSYWNDYPFMQGASFWQWSSDPNAGGPNDNDYTPQNKPAQNVLSQWFSESNSGGSGGTGGGSSGGSTSSGAFGISTTIVPNPAGVSQQATINANVTNNNFTGSGFTIDAEIYNQAGQRVYQQFFGNQNLAQGSSQNYVINWTPNAVGNYVLKIGVFNSNWSANYYWNDNALSFTVNSQGQAGGGSGGGIVSGTLNIWWPTNGSSISGVQPFKAMLTNNDVSSYNMYWQVDGGQLNAMSNSNTDYPHKEADVDVSGWNWKGNGPYTLNFVAKDLNGNLVGQQAVNVSISR